MKLGTIVVVLLLASCRRDDVARDESAAKSPCAKMRAYDEPQRYACIANCINADKSDYKVTIACRDACK